MATELLHCCICPKLPDFSDTSHLLTHVSSKGHLSHLHKLQVRSHKETAARHQLAAYNEWFSKNDIAQLLSERMLHKERKQAKKRADNTHRWRRTRQSTSTVDPSLFLLSSQQSVATAGVSTSRPTLQERSLSHQDEEDGFRRPRRAYGTDDCHSVLTDENYQPDAESEHSTPQPYTYSRSENAGLKGTVWPGMNMFDSADHETQRKRNQRKDGSVLERMRTMSSLIEPTETVHSPGGTMKKKRHIDDIEDDSPVEGETVMVKHPSKRKRKPLSNLDANVHRTIPQKAHKSLATYGYATTPFRRTPTMEHTFHRGLTSPVTDESLSALLGRPTSSCRRNNLFALYEDRSLDFGNTALVNLHANPLFESVKTYKQQTPTALPYPTWTRSTPRADSIYDPFKEYRETHLIFPEFGEDKENVNPLMWDRDLKSASPVPATTSFETFDDLDSTVGSLAHVYAFTRSSLADADTMA